MNKKGTYAERKYDLPVMFAYKNDYLKNKLSRGTLDIKCRNDIPKLVQSAQEKIETLKLFFSNEHLTDKDIKEIAGRVNMMASIEKVHADFGK